MIDTFLPFTPEKKAKSFIIHYVFVFVSSLSSLLSRSGGGGVGPSYGHVYITMAVERWDLGN